MTLKKYTAFFLAILLLTANQPAFAEDGPVEKLGRGLTNIISSPVEYANAYQGLNEEQGPVITIIGTLIYGTFLTAGRIIGGAIETVTFFIPIPEDYRPLMTPATPLDTQRQIAGKGGLRE